MAQAMRTRRRRRGPLGAIVAALAVLAVLALIAWMAMSGAASDDTGGRAADLSVPELPPPSSLPDVEPPGVPALPTPPAPIG